MKKITLRQRENTWIHPYIIFLCCLSSSFVFAEPVETLTWKDCVTEALANNPDIKSGKQDVRISQESKHLAGANLLPQISGDAQRNWSDRSTSTNTTSMRSMRDYSYGVSGQQLLFDGFKTVYDVNAAAKDEVATRFSYTVTSADVRYNLRVAFVELLKAQDMARLTKRIAARRRQNFELINLRYLAGREHRGSLLTAKANLSAAQADVIQAERDLKLSERQLLKVLGRQENAEIQAAEKVSSILQNKTQPDFNRLANDHPYYKQMTAAKDAGKNSLRSAAADLLPAVTLDASVDRSSSTWPPDETDWSAGITVSVPIFEGGSQYHQIQKSKAQYKKALADQQSAYNDLVYTLQESWTTWQDAMDAYGVQQQYLTAAQERSAIADAQYSSGLISFNDWTIIEDNLVNAQKSFLTAKMDVLIREAGWQQSKGEALDVFKK